MLECGLLLNALRLRIMKNKFYYLSKLNYFYIYVFFVYFFGLYKKYLSLFITRCSACV